MAASRMGEGYSEGEKAMSYADELENAFEGKEEQVPISWAEHSQIVRTSFMDGVKQGREPVMKLLRAEYEKSKSADLGKILEKLDEEELQKNAIIVMRPGPNWIKGLENLCKLFRRDSKIVEIGCYAGESSEVFAKYFDSGLIFCIDPWKGVDGAPISEDTHNYTHKLDIAEKVFNVMRRKYTNIVKLKGFDYEFLDTIPDNSMDGIYIDGNHYYESVKKNILAWLPKVKKGGYLCGHDYYSITPGVVRAVEEIFNYPDHVFEDSSWAIDLIKWQLRKNGNIQPESESESESQNNI